MMRWQMEGRFGNRLLEHSYSAMRLKDIHFFPRRE